MGTKSSRRTPGYIILFCVYYLICAFGCQPQSASSSDDTADNATNLPPDFIEFYKNFHQDSSYQLSHITFPLSGVLQDTSGRDSTVTWVAENWKLHAAVTPDDFWAVDFTVPFDGVVIEFIHVRTGGYWMERRFARMGTEWNLIYYGGLRASDQLSEDESATLEF